MNKRVNAAVGRKRPPPVNPYSGSGGHCSQLQEEELHWTGDHLRDYIGIPGSTKLCRAFKLNR